MNKKFWVAIPLCAILLAGTVLAAPVTSGNVTVNPETLAGSTITATKDNGTFDITSPGGKLPIAISNDGRTLYVAGNDAVKTDVAPVTTYESSNYKEYISYRNPLANTYKKLTQDKKLTVVYFGGSVTQGYKSGFGGWRGLSGRWFTENFPKAQVSLINAGLGESGTFMGTYRVQSDVIAQKPDLVFVEYAINDRYKGSTKEQAALQYETVIREIKQALPDCDIITLLVTDNAAAESLPALYPTAAGHAEIAEKYNIPVINVGAALINHMTDYKNETEWNTYFWDTVHPKDEGYKVYFECLKEYLSNMLLHTDYSGVTSTRDVLIPVQSENLLDGDRISVFGKDMGNYIVQSESTGFRYASQAFKPSAANDTTHNGYYYCRDNDDKNKITIKFTGTELAIWTNFYNTSSIMYVLDGETTKFMSCARHAPTQIVSDLEPGEHTVTIQPVIYGAEAVGQMHIGGLFIRDASKQSVKGDVVYYTDYNRLSLKLPAGSYTLKYFPLDNTAAALPKPQVASDKVFVGWRKADGKLLTAEETPAAGAVLTASIVDAGHVHTASGKLEYTDTEHWGYCSCGAVAEKEAHRYGEWVVTYPPTEGRPGEKERTCRCGAVEYGEVPMLTATEAPTTVTQPQTPPTEATTTPAIPTEGPVTPPTAAPTVAPTEVPTQAPTVQQTATPTAGVTQPIVADPTQAPTAEQTATPTVEVTQPATPDPTQSVTTPATRPDQGGAVVTDAPGASTTVLGDETTQASGETTEGSALQTQPDVTTPTDTIPTTTVAKDNDGFPVGAIIAIVAAVIAAGAAVAAVLLLKKKKDGAGAEEAAAEEAATEDSTDQPQE